MCSLSVFDDKGAGGKFSRGYHVAPIVAPRNDGKKRRDNFGNV